jgi:hypothetical protein
VDPAIAAALHAVMELGPVREMHGLGLDLRPLDCAEDLLALDHCDDRGP